MCCVVLVFVVIGSLTVNLFNDMKSFYMILFFISTQKNSISSSNVICVFLIFKIVFSFRVCVYVFVLFYLKNEWAFRWSDYAFFFQITELPFGWQKSNHFAVMNVIWMKMSKRCQIGNAWLLNCVVWMPLHGVLCIVR